MYYGLKIRKILKQDAHVLDSRILTLGEKCKMYNLGVICFVLFLFLLHIVVISLKIHFKRKYITQITLT